MWSYWKNKVSDICSQRDILNFSFSLLYLVDFFRRLNSKFVWKSINLLLKKPQTTQKKIPTPPSPRKYVAVGSVYYPLILWVFV